MAPATGLEPVTFGFILKLLGLSRWMPNVRVDLRFCRTSGLKTSWQGPPVPAEKHGVKHVPRGVAGTGQLRSAQPASRSAIAGTLSSSPAEMSTMNCTRSSSLAVNR
jgi:hypothetical protein